MSAGEYYDHNNRYGSTPSPQPPGDHYAPYGSQSTIAHGSQHLGAADRPVPGASPFDTVFDDHVYPAKATPSSSQHQLSQQDTGYHSLPRVSSEDMAYNHPTDDIPLQDQNRAGAPKDHADMKDHVYDAPQRRRTKKGGVRFGELGMFGANNSKKIPFVVYLFTLAQVVVFIVEIVRNGKHPLRPRPSIPDANIC